MELGNLTLKGSNSLLPERCTDCLNEIFIFRLKPLQLEFVTEIANDIVKLLPWRWIPLERLRMSHRCDKSCMHAGFCEFFRVNASIWLRARCFCVTVARTHRPDFYCQTYGLSYGDCVRQTRFFYSSQHERNQASFIRFDLAWFYFSEYVTIIREDFFKV